MILKIVDKRANRVLLILLFFLPFVFPFNNSTPKPTAEKCPDGYKNGEEFRTVGPRGMLWNKFVNSPRECSRLCDDIQFCQAFEYSTSNKLCKLNYIRDEDRKLNATSIFCKKRVCPVGYHLRAGAGFGDLNVSINGLSVKQCGGICNATISCNVFEYFEGSPHVCTHTSRYQKYCVGEVQSTCRLKRNLGSTTKPVMNYRLCQSNVMKDVYSRTLSGTIIKEDVCTRGLNNYISNHTHYYSPDNEIPASRIAFSSCIKVPRDAIGRARYQGIGETFWKDVKSFHPDVWLWLGDNTYDDFDRYNEKERNWDTGTLRMEYNRVREEESYVKYGLVAEDENGRKIPVMGVWDDHDAGTDDVKGGNNNIGKQPNAG